LLWGLLGLLLLVQRGFRILLVVDALAGCIGVSRVHVRGTSLLPRVRTTLSLRLNRKDMLLLSAACNYFNHLSRIAKTLVLFDKTLVDLAQVKFLLPIRQVLQVYEVAVGHRVRIFKKLVLLQINLQRLCVWEII
jgi:hypothetical protein